jgi:hypothetical protein
MERLRLGFLTKRRFAKNPMTEEAVGKKLKNAINESNDLARPLASSLKEAARAFLELGDERNELVHAHAEPDGRQQLVYQGKTKIELGRSQKSMTSLIDPRTLPSPFAISLRKIWNI